MIRVKIERRSMNRHIRAVSVEGHAGYAKPGKDIVCAGVSAVTVGTVNAINSLLNVELHPSMDKGALHFIVPDDLDVRAAEQVQLLLESMLIMLESIQTGYGKYMSMKEITI